MVTRLGKYLQVSYCSYQENEFFEDYAIMTIRQDYHVSGLKSLVGRYHSDMISPAIKSLSAHGGTVVISDITTDQRTQNYTAYFEENKLIAILYVPIMRKGVEVADLAVVQTSPREWREDEVALVEAVADRMWLALDAARFYNESLQAAARQRGFVRDVLESVTDGHLRICDADADLPAPLPEVGERVDLLAEEGLRRIRHAVRDIAREANFDDGRVSDLMTAVGEAAMNSVVHAGNGVAWICADIDTIQVWVSDTGRGIAVEKLPQATLVRGFSTAGTLGHGFKMILQSIDRVYLLTRDTGTTVVLEEGRTLPERVF
jgi:anti-sigma regulatory factor (Ser/Thr protein kinase)